MGRFTGEYKRADPWATRGRACGLGLGAGRPGGYVLAADYEKVGHCMTLNLKVIVASTRPGRVGLPVAEWFYRVAAEHPAFDAELVDLAAVALPLLDEPAHPRLKKYQHEHTRAWSRIVDSADAFVMVMPEYNHGVAPALMNAIDYLFHEWAYKPAGLVSYGGVSGGLRAAQLAKLPLTVLKVVPIVEAVVVPFVGNHIKDGAFQPNETQVSAAGDMLAELARWAEALKPLRAPAS